MLYPIKIEFIQSKSDSRENQYQNKNKYLHIITLVQKTITKHTNIKNSSLVMVAIITIMI